MEAEFEQLDWVDCESIAKEIFDLWSGGPELAWAEFAWGALARCGLTRYVTEVERSACCAPARSWCALQGVLC